MNITEEENLTREQLLVIVSRLEEELADALNEIETVESEKHEAESDASYWENEYNNLLEEE